MTAVLIIIVTILLCIYTLVMAVSGRGTQTISWTIRDWAVENPFVPFALGALMGHWLAPAFPTPSWGPFSLAVTGAGLMAGAMARPPRMDLRVVVLVLVVGFAAGGLLWSQPAP